MKLLKSHIITKGLIMIREKTALRIASEWYDGDGSALYMIVCGCIEKMRPEDFLRASSEIVTRQHFSYIASYLDVFFTF